MPLAFAVLLLYLATFAFFQAGKKRTIFESVKKDPSKQRLLKALGWVFAIVALASVSATTGLERGIPLWLAAFMLAAFSCLLIGSVFPKRHLASAQVVGGLALITGSANVIGYVV